MPKGSRNPTTSRLVRDAKSGDKDALESLFERSYPELLEAARLRLGPALRARMDTLDLAQTAYFDAVRDLRHYSYRGKGSFKRWLLAIVENKIRNRLKAERAQKRDMRREVALGESDVPASGTSPTRQLIAGENRERLVGALDQLPKLYREVIVSRYYLGLSWREVGNMLGRSEEASQMLCHRALQLLKKIYGE